MNNNGGFTFVVWYSRGEINDTSLIGMETQDEEGKVLDSGKIKYHIVQIIPTNRDIIEKGNVLNNQLNDLKFKVGDNL